MARRERSAFSGGNSMMWLPIIAAGQEMDRRIRTRHLPRPTSQPRDVISNEEYPFGRGGVYEVPFTGGDDGTQRQG